MSNTNGSAKPSLEELHALRQRLSSDDLDQSHLFINWPADPKLYNAEQQEMLLELFSLSRHYHGGVEQYIRNGRRLLNQSSCEGIKYISLDQPPFAYSAPSLFEPSAELFLMEKEGLSLVKKSVFVLVAGGLGERLGYSGIKLSLPVQTATRMCYLEYYLSWVRYAAGADAPFIMMTSNDTHDRTHKLISQLPHGMTNIHLLKQETVFCFSDTAAHLVLQNNNKLLRKPHGHGDVHSLIYGAVDKLSGRPLVETWAAQGKEYIIFFQDTNAPATLTIPIGLSISARHCLKMNFTCIPRQPKEAIGLLCHVQRANNNNNNNNLNNNLNNNNNNNTENNNLNNNDDNNNVPRTVNIEYNEFEAVAAALTAEGGDRAAPGTLFSPFPGSINTLILSLSEYSLSLSASHGAVPEFINPKFTDETKTSFKPCRVESLMQDVALLFDPVKNRVGATTFDRFTYQPVKNSLDEGVKKTKDGIAPHCAVTGEAEFYEMMRRRLCAAGVKIPKRDENEIDITVKNIIKVKLFPIIVADVVATGAALQEMQKLFPKPNEIKISARSTLIIEGRVCIESLELDGALKIIGPKCINATPLIVREMCVKNAGWTVRPTTEKDKSEVDCIRGYVLEEHEMQVVDEAKL